MIALTTISGVMIVSNLVMLRYVAMVVMGSTVAIVVTPTFMLPSTATLATIFAVVNAELPNVWRGVTARGATNLHSLRCWRIERGRRMKTKT
mmetsp:Transcript_12467/g.21098  ORF Transcript_12467/g.21098 Transcript_12467/m.21098 type:complete len:92 (+) Transcript_12467:185-460(+)